MLSYEKKYAVAMYLRLSREDTEESTCDGELRTSSSIRNQRELIRAFIQEHPDMELYDVYIDDGFSGSDFARPDFQRMMEDIKKREINCVITKDLSRFGRDYIESGRYIQKIFPALGVRYIAITDGYDSLTADAAEEGIVLPIKNFINDSYCRDISIKVKSHQKIQREKGEYIGAFACYGYKKSDTDPHQLVVDEPAAEIVRRIFAWRLDGQSFYAISNRLNGQGVLSPMEYKKAKGEKFQSGFGGKAAGKWSAMAVKRILTNEVYTGILVQGKRERVNYKVKKIIEKPQEEWVRIKNSHEAIIREEDFAVVQRLLETDCRMSTGKDTENNLFSGLLFCGDCGEMMIKRINRYKGQTKIFYICSSYNRGENCTRHSVSDEKLKNDICALLHKGKIDRCTLVYSIKKIVVYEGGEIEICPEFPNEKNKIF